MMIFSRVIWIVLDGVGVGALPDAAFFGDQGAATLPHVAAQVGGVALPNLERLGLGCITEITGVENLSETAGCWGKMAEKSAGKDSVTGHWELTGVIQEKPFATFPQGFPQEIIDAFRVETGLTPLGNVAASGTEILRQLGEEHLRTGRPIVYTSADSVFQIAAHEKLIAPERLYEICRTAEKILLPYNVCRVIARPFRGTCAEDFQRTDGRHDFPRKPQSDTLLDLLKRNGLPTCGIGKIHDLFAGEGLSETIPTHDNRDGMDKTLLLMKKINRGLIMTNLVDFDMLYGHRLDAEGFAEAMQQFDGWLPDLMDNASFDDLVVITADHGCDPTTPGTDHSREYVPLLIWSKKFRTTTCLGSRESFADLGATVAENFQVTLETGQSFFSELAACC